MGTDRFSTVAELDHRRFRFVAPLSYWEKTVLNNPALSLALSSQFEVPGNQISAEYLSKEGFKVDHETLRRWLLAEGKRVVRRRRQKHRQWRERKPCFGAMVQLDGSDHDWFEGRAERAVLMVMV